MRKIYLHIGLGKTGSSSLQSFLSLNSEFQHPETQEKFLYCCILKDGKILFGDELKRRAEQSVFKYLSSAHTIPNTGILDVLKSELDSIFDKGYTPIFSQENWGRRADNFSNTNFFKTLNVVADVIVYVRPQVDWFNSAWWQWFAWNKSFKNPMDVINAWGYDVMLWEKLISQWKLLGGVNSLKVRLHPNDIVEDFLGLFQQIPLTETSQKYKVNVSLPPILIKFLLKFPFLRRQHGAHVDIFLSRFLKFEGKPPWVIGNDLVHQIMDATRLDNEKLLKMLDDASQEKMKNDPRWWDAGYYRNHYVYNEKDLELTRSEMCTIFSQAIRSLINRT